MIVLSLFFGWPADGADLRGSFFGDVFFCVRDRSGKPAVEWNEMERSEDLQRIARPLAELGDTPYYVAWYFWV